MVTRLLVTSGTCPSIAASTLAPNDHTRRTIRATTSNCDVASSMYPTRRIADAFLATIASEAFVAFAFEGPVLNKAFSATTAPEWATNGTVDAREALVTFAMTSS